MWTRDTGGRGISGGCGSMCEWRQEKEGDELV